MLSTIMKKICKPSIFQLSPFKKFSSSSDARPLVNVIKDEEKKTANVVMQRLPVNSLNLELLQELTDAIADLEKNKFRGMILSSSSPTVFSAGLDITEMHQPDKKRFTKYWKTLQTMWKTLYMSPLITVAAVNGHAPAGGCLLTLSCDYSIMVKSRASIGLNETALGIAAPKWFRDQLICTIGFRKAEKALKLGTLFTPEEAIKLGMVQQLVDSPADLLPKCQEELERWMKIPEVALQMTKLSLRKTHVDELISYEDQELKEILYFVFQETTQEAIGRYLQGLKDRKGKH